MKHLLAFRLAIILLLPLVGSLTTCSKAPTEGPQPGATTSIDLSFTFAGESYELEGIGVFAVVDSFIQNPTTFEWVEQTTLLSISSVKEGPEDEVSGFFNFLITNYTGAGTYHEIQTDDWEAGGLWQVYLSTYSLSNVPNLSTEFYEDENKTGEMTITKQTDRELRGTFSVDAVDLDSSSDNPIEGRMQGEFVIRL